jgi:hypothetical protein
LCQRWLSAAVCPVANTHAPVGVGVTLSH